MDEENIGDLQCIAWHNNNETGDMYWSNRTQSYFH